MVQPVPTPLNLTIDRISIVKDGGSIQNLILFIRGKAMSCAPIIIGTSQLPNPPIITGITIKKIIIKACAVIIELNRSSLIKAPPGTVKLVRTMTLRESPIIPDQTPSKK